MTSTEPEAQLTELSSYLWARQCESSEWTCSRLKYLVKIWNITDISELQMKDLRHGLWKLNRAKTMCSVPYKQAPQLSLHLKLHYNKLQFLNTDWLHRQKTQEKCHVLLNHTIHWFHLKTITPSQNQSRALKTVYIQHTVVQKLRLKQR